MKLESRKEKVRKATEAARKQGLRIGLVPTMGYFHEGHLSLMRTCRSRCDFSVVSIYVNPIQFAPGEDLERYPRSLDLDLAQAEREGMDLVFAPADEEMYARDCSTFVEEVELSQGLCGLRRPGHFRGVATVVAKLFNIVRPDQAFFGQKDLQQLSVIRRMVRDLDFPVEIVPVPTVREPDGLAMSSRNAYLSPDERKRAPALYQSLAKGARNMVSASGRVEPALEGLRLEIEERTGGVLEYLSAVDENMAEVEKCENVRFLSAALKLGSARLIDNVDLRA
ncbi:MAG TPA: pantoate--beta-alanine ligase [archaeon]|nr:pantoate--beta-alanine ligase [archaeon]